MKSENIEKVLEALEALVEVPESLRAAEARKRLEDQPEVLDEVLSSLPFLEDGMAGGDSLRPPEFSKGIDLAGTSLGRYELGAALGIGGVGIVYEAHDTELDRDVAVKVLSPAFALSPTAQERFSREFRSAAALQHENIVSVHDSGESNGLQFCVMELIRGSQSLRGAKVTPERAAEIMSAVCRGLEHSHAAGVVHRDIKPGNILIAPDGTPKIADFGLAQDERFAVDRLTRTGELAGTLYYMSPEQVARRKQKVTHLTDVYSAGAVLYELLVHRPPHDGQTSIQIFEAIRDEVPRRIGDEIPRDLATICYKALRKAPSDRYQSSAEMADDLDRFSKGEPILARPESAMQRVKRKLSRPKVRLQLVGVLLLLSLAWGGAEALDARRQVAVRRAEQERQHEVIKRTIPILLNQLPDDYNPNQDPRFPMEDPDREREQR